MFNHLLLAYDGSEHAERAYKAAVDLALKLEAKFYIVQVETHAVASNWIVEVGQSPVTEMAKSASLVRAPLWSDARARHKGRKWRRAARRPRARDRELRQQNGCDLIVMGRRGRGRIEAYCSAAYRRICPATRTARC